MQFLEAALVVAWGVEATSQDYRPGRPHDDSIPGSPAVALGFGPGFHPAHVATLRYPVGRYGADDRPPHHRQRVAHPARPGPRPPHQLSTRVLGGPVVQPATGLCPEPLRL